MAITPTGQIILLNVPIEIDNKNQLTFSSETNQYNYFLSRKVSSFEYSDCSYLRKDSILKVPAHIDNLYNVNYLMYRNRNFSSKWFYAFITKKEYVSDNCTALTIKTDCYQTWQFNIDIKPSFVVREHTNDDTIGANTIEENLDIGDIVTINHSGIRYPISGCKVVIMSTYDPYNNKRFASVLPYNGTTFGCMMWAFDSNTTAGMQAIKDFILKTSQHIDVNAAIQGIFMCPSELLSGHIDTNDHNKITGSFSVYENIETYFPYGSDSPYQDYTPKNNKCYCWPYHFLEVTNSNGEKQQYKIEDFQKDDRGNILFTNYMALQVGISGRLCPTNYKGSVPSLYNNDVGVTLSKFPTCQWSSDYYTNWLTQNSVNRFKNALGIASSVMMPINMDPTKSVDKFATGMSKGISTANSIAGMISSYDSAKLQGNQTSGDNSGDVSFSMGANGYTFLEKRSKLENLRVIDNYFSMFGYKTNRLKVPNITGRSNWNYVETRNIDITGNAPQEDVQEIKNMFDNGVTLWHNPNTFGDYSQSNT